MESLSQFHKRIFVNSDKGKVFVWNTIQDKEKMNNKFEIWDLQTMKNYLKWLEENGN